MLKPLLVRRMEAACWVFGRRFSRLHRALPIPVVAFVYLCVAAGVCYLVARPLLRAPAPPADLVKLPDAPKPGFEESLRRVAELIAQKDFEQASAGVQALEKERPDDVRIPMIRGAIYTGQKSFPEALAAFQRALELSPNSEAALMNIAEIQFVQGRFDEAESLYQKLFQAQPRNTFLMFRLYLCARMMKDSEKAATLLGNPALSTQSLEYYYMQAAEEILAGKKAEGLKNIEMARMLYGEKTKPYDKTLARLKLIE